MSDLEKYSKYEKAVPTELIQLLLDIGYVATSLGKLRQAEEIFEGLIAARPESELPLVGYAFSKMTFGAYTEASKLLMERAMKLNPNSGFVQVFYGFLLHLTKRYAESKILLERVISEQQDPDMVNLAKEILKEQDDSDRGDNRE